jgi:hypothetical protein
MKSKKENSTMATAEQAEVRKRDLLPKWATPEVISRVRALLADGVLGSQIAKAIGVSQSSMYRLLSELGMVGYTIHYISTAANHIRCYGEEKCDNCGQPLPCRKCAERAGQLRMQREVSGEEAEDEGDPDVELRLAPEVADAAREVREQGFFSKMRNAQQPPWNKAEYERRTRTGYKPYRIPILRSRELFDTTTFDAAEELI